MLKRHDATIGNLLLIYMRFLINNFNKLRRFFFILIYFKFTFKFNLLNLIYNLKI